MIPFSIETYDEAIVVNGGAFVLSILMKQLACE